MISDLFLKNPSTIELLKLRDKVLFEQYYVTKDDELVANQFLQQTIIFISLYGIVEIRIILNLLINFILDNFIRILDYNNKLLLFEYIKEMDYYPHYSKLNLKEDLSLTDYLNLEIRKIGNKVYNDNQLMLYQNIKHRDRLIYSAPTSYGKTMVSIEAFISLISINDIQNLLIIVPTKALINEYKKNIYKYLSEANIKANVIESPYIKIDEKAINIFVFTQERVLTLFDEKNAYIIDYILVDEAQIMAILHNRRTILLLKALSLFPNCRKLFLTPFVTNFNNNVMSKIDNKEDYDEQVIEGVNSLVSNNKVIIDLYNNEDGIILYDATFKNDEDNFVKLLPRKFEKESENEFDINNFLNVINILPNLIKKDEQVIFFCSRKDNTMHWAQALSNNLTISTDVVHSKRYKALINHLKQNIHEEFNLIYFLEKSVAYHNGYLDNYTKRQIEYLFNESNEIRHLICTNTIGQGINLSAKNIFVFIKSLRTDNPDIDLINLLGRAARIKYNSLGNLFYVRQKGINSKYEKLFKESDKNINIQIKPMTELKLKDKLNPELRSYLQDSSINNDYKNSFIKNNEKLIRDELKLNSSKIDSKDYGIDNVEIFEIENLIHNLSKEEVEDFLNFHKSYESTFKFIEYLKTIYKWESKFIKTKYSRILNTQFVATTINKLIYGYSINQIINSSNYENKQLFISLKMNGISYTKHEGYEQLDLNNAKHINVIIINTLFQVQELIEFYVKRYIQDFYYRINKVCGIKLTNKGLENFLDFTTTDETKVTLYNIGLVDAFAINQIVNNVEYSEIIKEKVIDKNKLLEKVKEIEGDESPLYFALEDCL